MLQSKEMFINYNTNKWIGLSKNARISMKKKDLRRVDLHQCKQQNSIIEL